MDGAQLDPSDLDTYGHLFAAMEDDAATMAAVEAEFLGAAAAHQLAA